MHFLRLLSTPFSFHQQYYFLPPPHTNLSFYFYTCFHPWDSMGFLWNPEPKKNEGIKLSEEKICCRRWTTGSTSKTPLAVPSLQAQHPSPTSGKVVHFQGGGFFFPPSNPPLLYTVSEDVPLFLQQKDRRGVFFLCSHLQYTTQGFIPLQEHTMKGFNPSARATFFFLSLHPSLLSTLYLHGRLHFPPSLHFHNSH